MERQREGDVTPGQHEPMPQLVLTKGGAPLAGGEGMTVKVQKIKDNGTTSLIVEVTSNGKAAKAEVVNYDSMSDSAVADAITSQLKRSGIDARVTVAAGKVSIEPVK